MKEVLGLDEGDAEAQHGELIQAGADILREGQQARQLVQLPVQTIPVAFGGVGLGVLRTRFANMKKTRERKKRGGSVKAKER